MLIAFVHNEKAFLPEIEAYEKFFATIRVACERVSQKKLDNFNHDVEWHFMGYDRTQKRIGKTKVHEYASASVPPYRKEKDILKKFFNAKPDYRLFLNEYVRQQFSFKDAIPFGFRDMGVYPVSKEINPVKKEYDFVYAGDISFKRGFDNLIKAFTKGDLINKSLLVVSKGYEQIAEELKEYSNIRFIGPVPNRQVASNILKAKFAINYVPNTEPYNEQTSTKFLEYCAAQVPVISTDYKWVRYFQNKNGGNFYYLSPDLSNFTWDSITNFDYQFPDLKDFSWEKQIKNSGILEFLGLKS